MAASMREAGLLRAQPVQMLPEVSVRTAAPPVHKVLAGMGQCGLALRWTPVWFSPGTPVGLLWTSGAGGALSPFP